MDQTTGLLSGLCGLGIICGGLLVIGALVLVRLTGRGLLPLLSLWLNRRADSRSTDLPPLPRRRRVDLRARAKSVDFDSALAAASQPDPTAPPPAQPLNAAPSTTPLPPSAPERPWLNGRRRPRNEDEIFGGMLDTDGDGEADF